MCTLYIYMAFFVFTDGQLASSFFSSLGSLYGECALPILHKSPLYPTVLSKGKTKSIRLESSRVCSRCQKMARNTHLTINCLRVPPSGFLVKVYSSSPLHYRADPQGSGDFLSGFTPLAFDSPEPLSTRQCV